MAEEEKRVERVQLEERGDKRVLVIRWNTGKTSAGRLFGRYGAGGKPDFFRLLFGAIAGSLSEKMPTGSEVFARIKDTDAFRHSTREIFENIKKWFFNEVAPRYHLDKGDIFMLITEIEVDIDKGEVTWRPEKTEFYYWVRSDRCRGCEELAEENARLRKEVETLRAELAQVREKLSTLLK